MSAEEFEAEVERAVQGLPADLRAQIANVAFAVADGRENPNLLGLYHGVPLTRRAGEYTFALPDTITLYRLPILARCATRAEVVAQIVVTVKHEVGHYFGIDDGRLTELGYG